MCIRLKSIYNFQNVGLTSSDAIMAYAFTRIQDVTDTMIVGMEVTKLIAQVRCNMISKRATSTLYSNIFGYDFVVKRIHLPHILQKHLHAPGLLQRVTTMCCNAMMVHIAMA